LPRLDYEALDVMQMEMPPGWRGYGARDHIAHPDSGARQSEVDRIRGELDTASRSEIQDALMPYRHLLPITLQCGNARLGENE
jgi:fumarate reductase flavoprotein subunit